MSSHKKLNLALSQFRALLLKQLSLQRRSKALLVCFIIYPVVMMIGATLATLTIAYLNREIQSVLNNMIIPPSREIDLKEEIHNYFTYNLSSTSNAPMQFYYTSKNPEKIGILTDRGEKSGFLSYMDQFKSRLHSSENISIPYGTVFDSADEIDNMYIKIAQNPGEQSKLKTLMGAYIFEDIDLDHEQNPYIHYISQVIESQCTLLFGDFIYISDEFLCSRIFRSLSLNLISNAVANKMTSSSIEIDVAVKTMPDKYMFDVGTFLPSPGLYTIAALSFLLVLLLYTLILEKQSKLREMMKLSGLNMFYYWIITLGYHYVLYAILAISIFIASAVMFSPTIWGANPIFLIIFLVVCGFQLLSMAVFLSSIITSPLTGSIIGFLISFILPTFFSIIERYFLYKNSLNFLWLFIPNISMHHTLEAGIFYPCYEFRCHGFLELFKWNDFTMGILYMIFNTVWLFVVGFYLDVVLPQPWGVRKNPLFCFNPLFKLCFKKQKKNTKVHEHQSLIEEQTSGETTPRAVTISLEDGDVAKERQEAKDANPEDYPVILNQLNKKFGSKHAVNNLSLVLKSKECFGLLGPNGAGKTTTISVLCGLISPSSGTATISGYDINSEMDEVRISLGLCPQHEIIWPQLTVLEHLLFYARVKGIAKSEERMHVSDILSKVGLQEHGSQAASHLSGGMKRRLSIAIAMVGSPAVVLLDEPTTGLDPTTRRQIWDIIENTKKDRCIILTTHSLEEADLLSNRIGIVAKGKLQCIGDPFYLKRKFGEGYTLSVNFDETNRDTVIRFIEETIPNTKILSSFSGNVTFAISKNVVISDVCEKIEINKEEEKIRDWGLQQTTLEDVFMRIVEQS